MKITATIFFILFLTPAYAEVYKCIDNGNISYQQTQCKQKTADYTLNKDISIEQQQAAQKKLTAELELNAEKKKRQKQADDKERLIRAQEERARASYENAKASRAQAEAIARQTKAMKKRHNTPFHYYPYLPNSPIAKPLPNHPVTRPRATPVPPSARPLPATHR